MKARVAVADAARSPWATTEEGAEYVRSPNRDAFRKWAKRAGIIPAYRGRVPLYAWRDIDQALGFDGRAHFGG